MKQLKLEPVGVLHTGESENFVEVFPPYRPALCGLEGFGHVQLLWWFHQAEPVRSGTMVGGKPYCKGPDQMGIFATRGPFRPNPIGLSCAGVVGMDREQGILYLEYVDAFDGTPLLDIKPYTPSLDRVGNPVTPDWCAHWPQDVESSGEFDWAAEFNF